MFLNKQFMMLSTKEIVYEKDYYYEKNKVDIIIILDDYKSIKISYNYGIIRIIHFDKTLDEKGIDIFIFIIYTFSKDRYNNISISVNKDKEQKSIGY